MWKWFKVNYNIFNVIKILKISKVINFNIYVTIKKADPDLLNVSLYNLQNKVFDGYSAYIRPVSNPNTTTFINIDMTLLQVLSMVIFCFMIKYKR